MPILNYKFELPDGSYSVSDIQNYFECILKNHGGNVDKPSVQIYVIKFKIGLYLKLKMDMLLNF